jgi:ferredoxin
MAEEEKKSAWVDKGICIGCCLCASLAPGVYRMRQADGKSEVYNPDGASVAEVQNTISSCPVAAISWQDRKTDGSFAAGRISRSEITEGFTGVSRSDHERKKVEEDIAQQKEEGR